MDIQYDPDLGKLYYEQDQEIIRTGRPCHCYSEFIENGRIIYREIAKNPVYINGEIIGICGVVSDVTELMAMKKKFETLTVMDTLTGMYNRNYFEHEKDRIDLKKMRALLSVSINHAEYFKGKYSEEGRGDSAELHF